MLTDLQKWEQELKEILQQFKEQTTLKKGQIFIVGCSTSEVIGEKIGTAGTLDVAAFIFNQLKKFQEETGVHLAFQCCEHLNRAIVVEKETQERYGLEEVSVIPVQNAGGAMATYAYEHFQHPVVVETIKAHAGIDIGDTLIGMHLKPVVVPIRVSKKFIGSAHVTLATTRPKLIGGARAVYVKEKKGEC